MRVLFVYRNLRGDLHTGNQRHEQPLRAPPFTAANDSRTETALGDVLSQLHALNRIDVPFSRSAPQRQMAIANAENLGLAGTGQSSRSDLHGKPFDRIRAFQSTGMPRC
ncbi:hypothetical protein ACIBF1_32985 [Spirillospora sp. NPDC050679]